SLSITFVDDAEGQSGRMRVQTADIQADTSYPAGGYPITGHDAGVGTHIVGMSVIGSNSDGSNFGAFYNPSTGKIEFTSLVVSPSTTLFSTALDGSTNLAGTEGNADQAAAPVNSADFLAETAISVLAGIMTPTAQPDVPRNVVITIHNDTVGSLNLFL